MAGDEITTGELGRRISDLGQRMDDRTASIERTMATFIAKADEMYVRRETYEEARRTAAATQEASQDRISNLEKWRDWALTGVVGAVLSAVIAAFVLYSRSAPGGGS